MDNENSKYMENVKRREVLKVTALMMGGVALSSSAISVIFHACSSPSDVSSDDWIPLFFETDQIRLIAEIAERIIPKTDTPGAKDAFVDRVIDEGVNSNLTEEEQSEFVEELTQFNTKSQELIGKNFVSCSDNEKDQVLQVMAEEATKMKEEDRSARHIFAELRSMVIGAYLSSEIAAREFLAFDPIPGEWRGCIDYSEVGKVWAL